MSAKQYYEVHEYPSGDTFGAPLTAWEVHEKMLSEVWPEEYYIIEAISAEDAEEIYNLDNDDESVIDHLPISLIPCVFTSTCPFCGLVHRHKAEEDNGYTNQILKRREV